MRKRPLLRQNSPGRVSSRRVPAARAYLENLLASPLPPEAAVHSDHEGRGGETTLARTLRIASGGRRGWGRYRPSRALQRPPQPARPDKGCRRSRPATTRLAPWRRRRGFIFAVHAQRQSSALPKSFERGSIRIVRLSPVSAKSAFLGRSDDVRRHHQAFAL